MGCCGCTLQTSAIVAAVFGIIQSVAGLVAGIVVLTTSYNQYNSTNILINVFVSATIFNALWLIATVVLIVGIVKENAVMHRIWVGATSVIMVADLVHSIIFVIAIVQAVNATIYVNSSSYGYTYYSYDSSGIFIVALLMTAVSRGSIWLWIVNICLTIYTAHRANEIERGPVHSGQTVLIYGNQPAHSYAIPGQTIVIQHGGAPTGMPPTYDYQQPQYGQQPPTQYRSPPVDSSAPEKALLQKH